MADVKNLHPQEAEKFVLGALAVAFLPLFYLLYDLLAYRNDVSSWLSMRLEGARLLLRQAIIYTDFWDWSQPIVFESLKIPLILRDFLEKCGLFLPVDLFMQVVIWLDVCISVVLTAFIALSALKKIGLPQGELAETGIAAQGGQVVDAIRSELMDLTYALTFSVVLCSLIMRFDFGDLPHLLILALAPWILMRWLFYQNIAPARWLRVITGLLAGLTACCDLPFAFFFVIVELALVLESGTWRKICSFSGEWLVFLSTALCYLIRLSQLPEPAYTAFWKWTMPLKLLNYAVYDSNLYGPNSCPDRRDLLYCLALALAFVFSLSKNRSSFAPIFSIMLSGFGLYILEKEGLSRDLAPVIFGCSAAFALTFLILGRLLSGLLPRSEQQLVKGFKYPALLMTSVIVTMFFGCSLNWDRDRLHTFIVGKESAHCDDLLTVYYADKIAVEPIMIMSDYPEAAYPALLNFDAHPIGYLLWARPLRLFDYAISKCLLTADLKDFYEYVCRQIRSDLQNRKVKHLLLQTYECDLLKRAGIFGSVASDYQFDKECLYYSLNRQPREFVGLPYFSHFVRKDR